MTIRAIPTVYGGRLYRSRLEARWAVMFDLMGIVAEYEPFDLPGWIPDFILPRHLSHSYDVLVEVKPFTSLHEFDLAKIERALETALNAGHSIPADLYLLGCTVTLQGTEALLGWAYSKTTMPGGRLWICPDGLRALAAWAIAGDIVQWKSPQSAYRRAIDFVTCGALRQELNYEWPDEL